MASAKPSRPPGGADFSALVKKVNELAGKVSGVAPLSETVTGRIPMWKRWVGGEKPEYAAVEAGGLYTVIKANAGALDDVKDDFDQFRTANLAKERQQDDRLAALEAQARDPFLGSG